VAIEVDTATTAARVKAVLERLADLRGLPRSITVDHGPEFEGQVLDPGPMSAACIFRSSGPAKS
jgi:putative transposase